MKTKNERLVTPDCFQWHDEVALLPLGHLHVYDGHMNGEKYFENLGKRTTAFELTLKKKRHGGGTWTGLPADQSRTETVCGIYKLKLQWQTVISNTAQRGWGGMVKVGSLPTGRLIRVSPCWRAEEFLGRTLNPTLPPKNPAQGWSQAQINGECWVTMGLWLIRKSNEAENKK